jgi:UMF1 family MFS transporter
MADRDVEQHDSPSQANRRQMLAWASYDWANSSFATLIQTFVFANYFTRQIADSEQVGQSQWALTIGGAGVAVALCGPLLGAIADQGGRRKPWIAAFTSIAVVATAAMWFVTPEATIWLALGLLGISTFATESANVFYNAMLPGLAGPRRIGRWSGWGWAIGYFGGLACLMVGLLAFVGWPPGTALISDEGARHIRATFLLVAGWFAIFSLPMFLLTPDTRGTGKRLPEAAQAGIRQLIGSVREVRRYAPIVRFLIARLFYIDALASIFAMGGVYASGVFDMDATQIMLFGIALNVTAGVGAFGLSWLDDWIGSRRTILLSLIGILVPGIGMLVVGSVGWFWVCGLTLGLFVGPVQSASRAYMARAAPEALRTEAFGLYALSGKATAFAVPLVVGGVTAWSGSQRWGMTPILVFMAIGFAILLTVPNAQQVISDESSQQTNHD